jgi:hypothetical protein
MPRLTLKILSENPSSIFTHRLPLLANRYVLLLAIDAATYCAHREWILCEAAREGFFEPPGWKPLDGYPDVHEYNEARALEAETKREKFIRRYRLLFGDDTAF